MWFWPLVCIGAGIALSLISVAVDRTYDGGLIPRALTGGPDAALEILGTVAGSMVSLTALVLTVVLVVVQLAMGQFSPRIVAAILQDKPSQFAIGIFVGTFAHAMLTLSQVSTAEGDEFVPGVAIVVAFVLIIVSIMVLVLYVNHIGRKLRAGALIEAVSDQIRHKLDELYPEQLTDGQDSPGVLCAPRSGVLLHIDRTRLIDLARRADVELEVLPALGDFVPAGAPLVRIKGHPKLDIAPEVLRRISLDTERFIRSGSRLWSPIVGRHLRARARRPVRPDNRGASHRPSPRLSASPRNSEVPKRRLPRPSRHGAGGDQDDFMGRLRAPVIRGDPQSHRRVGSDDAPAARLSRRSVGVRA
jgi:uncharacterized membrane protein